MFDEKKYGYVVVKMEKDDYALETLVDDLERHSRHLNRCEVRNKYFVIFKGLLNIEEIAGLDTLRAMSPYGGGYDVKIDGMDIDDPMIRKRFREAGIKMF